MLSRTSTWPKFWRITREIPLNRRPTSSSIFVTGAFYASRSMTSTAEATAKIESDYSQWSSEKLVQRVLQLETELKQNLDAHVHAQPQPSAPESIPRKTPGKASKLPKTPKAFDPSKYTTRPIALKFAYRGSTYNGFEHHVNNTTPLPTIEEELWKALVQCRLISPPSLKENGLDGAEMTKRLDGYGPGTAGVGSLGNTPVDWEGCEYSKCGRTDRGVSAFGQVIGITVRSARGQKTRKKNTGVDGEGIAAIDQGDDTVKAAIAPLQENAEESEALDDTFDPVKNELPYIALLNKVLPPTIRVLAWCPSPPENFSARFSCKEREYRYFFTSPAYLPLPGSHTASGSASCWLDISAMQEAASYLVGSHDFRNLCKVDASKQITNFSRSIRHASIDLVTALPNPALSSATSGGQHEMGLYTFTVCGSAFLWHQVRCMVAVLFLVGQGLEKPTIVKELLDIEKCPGRPKYEMASGTPLVLWDCKFSTGHGKTEEGASSHQRHWDRGAGEDELEWVYAGKEIPQGSAVAPGKWGRNGLMEDLWKNWRATKMEETLTAQLMNIVASQATNVPVPSRDVGHITKVFAGDDFAPNKGKYIPIMQKQRMEPVEIINARYAERKGIQGRAARDDDANE